jgi:cysteine desulfurase/selenocysteine lyase
MSQDSPSWADFRRQMPVTRRWAYLDHAAVAPLSAPSAKAMQEWIGDLTENGDVGWSRWETRVEDVRRHGAALMGADPAEIALIRNTTEGVSLVAEGFPWQPGDNLVTLADEFPSNIYPWLNLASRGVETRRVPVEQGGVDLARLAEACDARTRMIAVSWVGYASGWRHDLAELVDLARAKDAYLFLDAIQGLGVFPLDVRATPVDFLAADGHKWLLGPEGAGLFFVRREHLDLLRPLGVGWNSVVQAHNFMRIEPNWKPSAARYEGGSYNMAGLMGLGASLELLAQFGAAAISAHVLELTDLACRRLTEIGGIICSSRDPRHASSIVSFELPGQSPSQVRQKCLQHDVALGSRAGRVRISLHAYNNVDDIERLIVALTA